MSESDRPGEERGKGREDLVGYIAKFSCRAGFLHSQFMKPRKAKKKTERVAKTVPLLRKPKHGFFF